MATPTAYLTLSLRQLGFTTVRTPPELPNRPYLTNGRSVVPNQLTGHPLDIRRNLQPATPHMAEREDGSTLVHRRTPGCLVCHSSHRTQYAINPTNIHTGSSLASSPSASGPELQSTPGEPSPS
jgi:hypothetical protein